MARHVSGIGRIITIAALGAFAAGCTMDSEGRLSLLGDCQATTAAAAGIDWGSALVREVVIEDSDVRPNLIHLHPQSPSVIRLINNDGTSHSLKAPEFFHSVQVVAVGAGDPAPVEGCMSVVTVPAGETVDVRVVTGEADSYDYGIDAILTLIPAGIEHGVIAVR